MLFFNALSSQVQFSSTPPVGQGQQTCSPEESGWAHCWCGTAVYQAWAWPGPQTSISREQKQKWALFLPCISRVSLHVFWLWFKNQWSRMFLSLLQSRTGVKLGFFVCISFYPLLCRQATRSAQSSCAAVQLQMVPGNSSWGQPQSCSKVPPVQWGCLFAVQKNISYLDSHSSLKTFL